MTATPNPYDGVRRYLTPEEKRGHLADWDRCRAEWDGRLPEKPGGLGYPDPDIYALCDALNALDGVCTVQSCAGHWNPPRIDPDGTQYDGHYYNGQLWIRLSRPVWLVAFDCAHELARAALITRVSFLWSYDNEPVLDICFQGGGGRPELADSSDVILRFLRRCSEGRV